MDCPQPARAAAGTQSIFVKILFGTFGVKVRVATVTRDRLPIRRAPSGRADGNSRMPVQTRMQTIHLCSREGSPVRHGGYR